MDLEQLEKRIEWLEKERREDKQAIALLERRLADYENSIEQSSSNTKGLESEITQLGVKLTKLDTFEHALSLVRSEVKNELEGFEKENRKQDKLIKQRHEEAVSELSQRIEEVALDIKQYTGLPKRIDTNQQEIFAQNRKFDEIDKRIRERYDSLADLEQKIKIVEEDLATEKKRFPDIFGELSALRKRVDEQRAQYELSIENYKKVDTRVNEMLANEAERQQGQRAFIDEITLAQHDVERSFKEWTKRFDDIEKRAETLTTALQTYTEVERSLRKAQEEFDEISEKLSRRIHEITEMQRLGEERFRQEWTTFKSDDQKRWVNYTLTQEEQVKENVRRFERLTERTTTLEELLQDLQDTVQHSNEQVESLMQNLLGVFREWVTTNERFADSV